MKFHALEKLSNLHDNYRKVVEIENQKIMLIQHEGKLSLLEATCPHAGYPMDDAKVIDGNLRCSMHAYLFDISSGKCTFYTEGPCRGLKTYDIIYRDSEVGVRL